MMTTKLPITVYLLVNRIDDRLDQALQSVAWASEIVIGWQGVVPPGPAQLKAWKVTVNHDLGPAPIQDFAKARQALEPLGTEDWLFWIDSDEVVPAETAQHLASLVQQEKYQAWSFRRVDVFAQRTLKWGEVYHQDLVRLYRRGRGKWVRSVHEYVEVAGPASFSGLELLHYAHPNIQEFWQAMIGYAQLEADHRVQSGQRWQWWQLGFPLGKWWFNLLWRQAWRDGWPGILYALLMSIHSLVVRVTWWERLHAPS